MVKRDFIILGSLLLLTGLLRFPSLFEPYWHGDEGITLTVGQTIRNGGILYKDIADNKTPFLYFIASVFNTLPLLKGILFAWMIITVSGFYLLARKLIAPHGAAAAGILFVLLTNTPYMDGNIANGEIFYLLPNLAAIYLSWIGYNHHKYKYFIGAGILFGVAFLFKPPALFEMIAAGFFLIISEGKNWKALLKNLLYLGSGFLIPNVIIILYFFVHNALYYYWRFAFLWNFAYSSYHNNFLFLKITAALALVLIILFLKKKLKPEFLLILLLLIFTGSGSLLSSRPYIHYYLPIIPPLCLLFGSLYVFRKTVFFSGIILLFVWRISADLGAIEYQGKYYKNFAEYTVGKISLISYRNFFDPAVAETYEIADFLKQTPAGPVFIWGDNPMIYALSHRRPAGRFSAAYNIHFEEKRGKETLTAITEDPPQYIIYLKNVRFTLPGLDMLLANEYNIKRETGNALIYERKS